MFIRRNIDIKNVVFDYFDLFSNQSFKSGSPYPIHVVCNISGIIIFFDIERRGLMLIVLAIDV